MRVKVRKDKERYSFSTHFFFPPCRVSLVLLVTRPTLCKLHLPGYAKHQGQDGGVFYDLTRSYYKTVQAYLILTQKHRQCLYVYRIQLYTTSRFLGMGYHEHTKGWQELFIF